MNFISNLIMKYMGGQYLLKVLDLIPLKGRRTFLCGLATALAVLNSAYHSGTMQALVDVVTKHGGIPVLPADQLAMLVSAMATVLFLLAKALRGLQSIREQE